MKGIGSRSVVAVVLLAGCAVAPHHPAEKSLAGLLRPIPGSERYLAHAAGRVVLVDVWASWCRTCDLALRSDAALQRDLEGQGFDAVTVNVDADPRAADAFLKRLGLGASLSVLRDSEARQAEVSFGLSRLPTAFVVDRHGLVRKVESGYSASARERVRQTVMDLLREAP